MPSRLIQGLDNFDTCSQFSDSATLHTLTRIGAFQKEVYFSRSESNFNNLDTISYGNSSTCCCDAEIKMDLQLRNSIYQCNPRCNFEKRNKIQSASAKTTNATTDQFKSTLLERFERERGKQRNNYLNKLTYTKANFPIEQPNPFRIAIEAYKYSTKQPSKQKKMIARANSNIDIQSIPLPASVLNRRSTSFRQHYNGPSTQSNQSGFKLIDLLNSKKNNNISNDMRHKPALNHLKKICRSNTALTDRSQEKSNERSTFDRQKISPLESFAIDANIYHEFHAKNQPLPMDVKELHNSTIALLTRNYEAKNTLSDIQSVHASTCNLVTTLRASNQSIVNAGSRKVGGEIGGHLRSSSKSDINLKYDSIRSHKGRTKRSNSEQLNPSYYHFQNIDGEFGEMDNINAAFESVLLPTQSTDGHKLPWKHRQCLSITSSNSSSSTNVTKWDLSKHWLAITSILLIVGAAGVAVPLALRVASGASYDERLQAAYTLLENVPLIDGHNDLPYNIRKFVHNQLADFDFDIDLKHVPPWSNSNWSHTDLHRLKMGRVSAQFWAAYVPCEAQYKDAVQITLEQIDVIIRLTDKYSTQLTICASAKDIVNAHKDNKICSLIGVEGGHSISGSLAVLRTYYLLGVRYMTLTSTCHTPWADSSYADAPKFDVKHGGLTDFGKRVIKEMNRLGMVVDLSHVSMATMRDAMAYSEAPVIFSHSSAYELCNSSRNVQDPILRSLVKNRGIIMLNFYSMFLSCGQNATVYHAVAHLNHIKRVAGVDYIGIGAGYDGINHTPSGLEDASKYPVLFAELMGVGWSVEDLTKLAGANLLRVLKEVETIRDKMKEGAVQPYEDILANRGDDPYNCTTT